MAYSTGTMVNEVLHLNGTQFTSAATSIGYKIVDADAYITERLTPYALTVSGTSSTTISASSKYLSASLWIEDYTMKRGENEDPRATMWRNTAEKYLLAYIKSNAYDRLAGDSGYGRVRRPYSTTYDG